MFCTCIVDHNAYNKVSDACINYKKKLKLHCIAGSLKYAHIGLKQSLLRSITLEIITRLLDNAAFVLIHVVERFSKDFSEVRGLRNRGVSFRLNG